MYLTRHGFTAQQAGAAVSLYGGGALIASLIGGRLADSLGRVRTIALSMFGSAAAMLALSQADRLPLILGLTAAAGLTGEAYRPASNALLADLVPAGRRVSAFAALRFMLNAGVALGAATAGLLAQRSFFAIFLLDALTSLIFAGLVLLAVRETRPATSGRRDPSAGYRVISGDRAFLLFLLGGALVAFVYLQAFTTFALQAQRVGYSAAVFGGLIALNGLLIVVAELPLTALTQHRPPRPVIAAGFVLIGLGVAVVGYAQSLILLVLAVVLWTMGEMINAPMASALVADSAPAGLRGRYQGAWGLAWGVGLVLGPVVGTSLFAWNARGFWLSCGGLATVGAALVLASGRQVSAKRGS